MEGLKAAWMVGMMVDKMADPMVVLMVGRMAD